LTKAFLGFDSTYTLAERNGLRRRVPDDEAAGGVHDEGVGVEAVVHLLHQAASFSGPTIFISRQS
jgi:hypothetical protein